MTWESKARERLQQFANRHFSNWCQTKEGIKWKNTRFKKTRRSPYAFGFFLPDYHHDLIEALGRGDEETAKGLMLTYYVN